MSIYVGKQYSSRHKIPFDSIPSVKQVYKLHKFNTVVNPAYAINEYSAMLDTVFEHTDMVSTSNGETIPIALWSVLQSLKKEEGWYILVRDQKTIMRMLSNSKE